MNLLRERLRATGAHLLRCSDAPDMSGANAAALAQADLSKEQLAWVKDVYEQEAPQRADAVARANAVSDAQLASQKQADELASASALHYNKTFKPIEERIAGEAMNYDTPERRTQAAGQAMADVGSQGAIARETTMADLASRGVDPSSGSAGAAMSRIGAAEAAARAAAGNTAINQVETVGAAKRMDAAGLGRGVVSSQGTQAGLALNAGNASVGSAQAGLNIEAQGTQQVQTGYGTAINGLGSSAQSQLGIAKAGQSDNSGLASLAGAGMMAFAV